MREAVDEYAHLAKKHRKALIRGETVDIGPFSVVVNKRREWLISLKESGAVISSVDDLNKVMGEIKDLRALYAGEQ